ncbi:MAG: hypothetical protein ACK505_05165, partial [Flavobacteriales bacterium]
HKIGFNVNNSVHGANECRFFTPLHPKKQPVDSLVLTPFSRISRFTALISCDLHRAKELGMDSFRVLKKQ